MKLKCFLVSSFFFLNSTLFLLQIEFGLGAQIWLSMRLDDTAYENNMQLNVSEYTKWIVAKDNISCFVGIGDGLKR